MKKSNKFVEPEERSTGYKFKRIFDENAGCTLLKTVQTTFQFVPITKTLTALFSDTSFENAYMNFNTGKNHACEQGAYVDFCCGSAFKTNEFFTLNPLAIQIRLFTDDFEPCDPLKSKAGAHKITAFYFQINNFPKNQLSKTENIHLVALSDASDSKSELSDAQNVIETIIADLKTLETKGIVTGNDNCLKGALMCVSFDNLGGNVLFGFSGGFQANYYCRICTSTRQICQKLVTEDTSTLRNIREYDEIVAQVESDATFNLTKSKGIKSSCILNTLNNFHILTNMSVDLMHDVFEGTVGFLLEEVFNYCISNKIATIEHLKSLTHCFHYGTLSSRNIPSKLNLDKKNVGQNASQARCLMIHLPFILFKYKQKLESMWLTVESMLRIMQILLSEDIKEVDLKRLSQLITTHLRCYQLYFDKPLKPKHHFLVHYEGIIRSMGPVIRFWAMRMEAKHQFFKNIAFRTKNFINIKQTLAQKHQEKSFATSTFHLDDIERGKETFFMENDDCVKYFEELRAINISDDSIEKSIVIKSVKINSCHFKPGFLIASTSNFLEIQYIMLIESQIYFLCNKSYDIQYYDSFLNSFKIDYKEEVSVSSLNSLKIAKPYEKKIVYGDIYVIVDCLSTFNLKNN